MIEITPAIMGPGIEEEYADALAAITDLRRALGERRLTNDTPDGRLLLEVAWVEQEIRRQRLSIPVARSYAGTIYYLVGSGELDRIPGLKGALGRLYVVLQGIGLVKPRHVPVLVSMIDDIYADARRVWEQLTHSEQATMDDIQVQADTLRKGEWPAYRQPQDQFPIFDTPNLDRLVNNFSNRGRRISSSVYDGWRPYPAQKPPLAAPVPGLVPEAAPLPHGLAGRLP